MSGRLQLLQFTPAGEIFRTLAVCGALDKTEEPPRKPASILEEYPAEAVVV